jgi:hypothetical protein
MKIAIGLLFSIMFITGCNTSLRSAQDYPAGDGFLTDSQGNVIVIEELVQ